MQSPDTSYRPSTSYSTYPSYSSPNYQSYSSYPTRSSRSSYPSYSDFEAAHAAGMAAASDVRRSLDYIRSLNRAMTAIDNIQELNLEALRGPRGSSTYPSFGGGLTSYGSASGYYPSGRSCSTSRRDRSDAYYSTRSRSRPATPRPRREDYSSSYYSGGRYDDYDYPQTSTRASGSRYGGSSHLYAPRSPTPERRSRSRRG